MLCLPAGSSCQSINRQSRGGKRGTIDQRRIAIISPGSAHVRRGFYLAVEQIGNNAALVNPQTTLARSVLHYTFHRECAKGRVLITDLFLRIASGIAPPLHFVHVLELHRRAA